MISRICPSRPKISKSCTESTSRRRIIRFNTESIHRGAKRPFGAWPKAAPYAFGIDSDDSALDVDSVQDLLILGLLWQILPRIP